MRISDWSSDVCSSDLAFWEYYMWNWRRVRGLREVRAALAAPRFNTPRQRRFEGAVERGRRRIMRRFAAFDIVGSQMESAMRSEEHTSELQSLMRISYAVFCLKKKTHTK